MLSRERWHFVFSPSRITFTLEQRILREYVDDVSRVIWCFKPFYPIRVADGGVMTKKLTFIKKHISWQYKHDDLLYEAMKSQTKRFLIARPTLSSNSNSKAASTFYASRRMCV